MTRRGTLAYYLAAWVVGCFITAALFMSTAESVRVSMFLVTYFFALMGGLAGLLLFALLLRLAMRSLGTHNLLIWAVAGAAIFSAVVFLLALVSEKRPVTWWTGVPLAISNLLFAGPTAVRRTGLWQAPIDGAVTAAVLCLVDRAFDRPGEVAEAKQSPA